MLNSWYESFLNPQKKRKGRNGRYHCLKRSILLLNLLNESKVSNNTSCYQVRLCKLEKQAFTVDECILKKNSFYLFLYLQFLEQCLAHSGHSINIAE